MMNVIEFGRKLISTNDLDPVYVVLWETQLEEKLLHKWLLAYWCFYHAGTASWIVDGGPDYWQRMLTAAGSKKYPRSPERRHFRGGQALRSVTWLKEEGVDDLFLPLAWNAAGEYTIEEVMEYVQTWKGFGPWISFKVADMLERLAICKVKFDQGAMFLFDSPKQGAKLMWKEYHETSEAPSEQHQQEWAVNTILKELNPIEAPPRYNRYLNVQEAETVLCKWKSYMGGHYEIGEDIQSLKKGLNRFGQCRIARKLLAGGILGGLWK